MARNAPLPFAAANCARCVLPAKSAQHGVLAAAMAQPLDPARSPLHSGNGHTEEKALTLWRQSGGIGEVPGVGCRGAVL